MRPDPVDEAARPGPERRCLVSRQTLPKERLVRFVVGPAGAVVPDVAGALPGRGLWLAARRDIVARACATHAFAKAARREVGVGEALADQVERLLASRCLELIGLARRAGQAHSGLDAVRRALARGRAAVLVCASDGSARERARLRARGTPGAVVDVLSSSELGGVFGRPRVVHVALGHGSLADRFRAEAARLAGFRAVEQS